ncbi:hypothetical protein pb186bvf_014073 [Paramecium bursaria]
MNCNIGDVVSFIKNGELKYGKIEEFRRDEDWFEYVEYLAELPTGIILKNVVYPTMEAVNYLEQKLYQDKCQVQKLPQYLANDCQGYVQRQDYIKGQLLPELKKCICSLYVNPDSGVICCPDCQKSFHLDCLRNIQGAPHCDQCRYEFDLNTVKINRKIEVIPNIQRVINIEDEDEGLDLMVNKNRINLDLLIKKNKSNSTKSVATVINVPVEEKKAQQSQNDKQPQRKYPNITSEQASRIEYWLGKYKQMETNLSGIEKKRQEVRERLFCVLYYGFLELANAQKQNPNLVTNYENELLNYPENQVFQYFKNLSLEIEVFLHVKLNNPAKMKLENAYMDRCKLIYMHLKDDKNLELRRKVISKEFHPVDLCTKDERDLYNPERRKETQEIVQRQLEQTVKEKPQIQDNMEIEFDLSRQPSTVEDHEQNTNRRDPVISKTQQLKEKLSEFSIEKSYQRFKKRIIDELPEREQALLLQNLEIKYKKS